MTDRWVAPRILFWGTPGIFAYQVFQALVDTNTPIVGVILPGAFGSGLYRLPHPAPPPSDVLMLPSFVVSGLAESAWQQAIPVFQFGGEGNKGIFQENSASWNALMTSVAELAPTVMVVACWHIRFPQTLLAMAEWGGWNIHPSLLPDFRGPTPLFWQRRIGLKEGGVSIHTMVQRWDAGAIHAQAPVVFPEGATMDELDGITGAMGGRLLIEVLAKMTMEVVQPIAQPSGGSYQSFPQAEDFVVPTHWEVSHAWNFMRAAESFGIPFTIQGQNHSFVAQRALHYQPDTIIPEPWSVSTPTGVAVQFSRGVLVVA